LSKTILTFLRHASLVKPLGEPAKLKMANDMAQIEFLLGPLFQSTGLTAADLGESFQSLRAYR
jgi:hypothetical protein